MGDDARSAGGHDDPTGRVQYPVAADAPITWRAAPPPTSESAAAVAAGDAPISWRADALPTTESAAVRSDEQAPGAAEGSPTPTAPPERTSPSAPAQRGGGTMNVKRSWLIFYGFIAVLIAVDVVGAGLANTSDGSKASTHRGASETAPATFATTLSTTTTAPPDTFPMGTKVAAWRWILGAGVLLRTAGATREQLPHCAGRKRVRSCGRRGVRRVIRTGLVQPLRILGADTRRPRLRSHDWRPLSVIRIRRYPGRRRMRQGVGHLCGSDGPAAFLDRLEVPRLVAGEVDIVTPGVSSIGPG